MSTQKSIEPPTPADRGSIADLYNQYGSDAIELAGTANALYERHLVFDDVVDLAAASPRERFVALARSVRDILSQRLPTTDDPALVARHDTKET